VKDWEAAVKERDNPPPFPCDESHVQDEKEEFLTVKERAEEEFKVTAPPIKLAVASAFETVTFSNSTL
jgi:hypothetical protein